MRYPLRAAVLAMVFAHGVALAQNGEVRSFEAPVQIAPDRSSEVVTVLVQQTVVELLKDTQGGFRKVKLQDGRLGWVEERALDLLPEPAAVKTVAPPSPPLVTAARPPPRVEPPPPVIAPSSAPPIVAPPPAPPVVAPPVIVKPKPPSGPCGERVPVMVMTGAELRSTPLEKAPVKLQLERSAEGCASAPRRGFRQVKFNDGRSGFALESMVLLKE